MIIIRETLDFAPEKSKNDSVVTNLQHDSFNLVHFQVHLYQHHRSALRRSGQKPVKSTCENPKSVKLYFFWNAYRDYHRIKCLANVRSRDSDSKNVFQHFQSRWLHRVTVVQSESKSESFSGFSIKNLFY